MSLLEVDQLEKVYDTDHVVTPVLRGITFAVEQGEFVAIMGPSGSGKSTLLHILGFLDKQTHGTYRFDDKSIDECTDDMLAWMRNKRMGFVFQSFNLLPRTTVFQNVRLPLLYSDIPEKDWHSRCTHAIADVGLSHRSSHTSSELSGGEKQRVAIARALVNDPDVIFADEPTGNLDSGSGQVVMSILQDLHKNKRHTIILITHETYTAEHAERIIYMKDGRIVSDTRLPQIRTANDGFKK